MGANIDYWERILKDPTSIYQIYFDAEAQYLHDHVPLGASVLDIGCGEGRVMKLLLGIAGSITGIDNDPQAITDAKKNIGTSSAIQILLADATKLPFPNTAFDVVVLLATLVNFGSDKLTALKEIARVAKKTGSIIVSVYSEHALAERLRIYTQLGLPIQSVDGGTVVTTEAAISEQFSMSSLNKLITAAGLRIAYTQEVEHFAYICTLEHIV